MKIVGLTGCIGSGKSSVSDIFQELGARVVDADIIAREVVAKDSVGLASIVSRFGREILTSDGSLDRARLAELVFGDTAALADLNAIVHPLVNQEMMKQITDAAASGFDGLMVLVIPLLAEGGRDRYPFSDVVVVDIDPEIAIQRLVRFRGMSESDARARLSAQVSRQARLDIATMVIANSGSVEDLRRRSVETYQALTSGTDSASSNTN